MEKSVTREQPAEYLDSPGLPDRGASGTLVTLDLLPLRERAGLLGSEASEVLGRDGNKPRGRKTAAKGRACTQRQTTRPETKYKANIIPVLARPPPRLGQAETADRGSSAARGGRARARAAAACGEGGGQAGEGDQTLGERRINFLSFPREQFLSRYINTARNNS